MSDKKDPPGSYPQLPSAPPDYSSFGFQGNRNPPPSYEESQKYAYPSHPPPAYPQGSQFLGYPTAPSNCQMSTAPGASYMPYYNTASIGYSNNTPMHNFQHAVHQQQNVVYSNIPQQNNGPQAVLFDSGARFKGKGAGAVTVPPPPPGYLPTPAQIAALQGQPVMLQKKKKSFF